MKSTYIKKAGKVLVTSDDFEISYFHFDGPGDPPTLNRQFMIECERLALQWAVEKINDKLLLLSVEEDLLASGAMQEPWSLTVDIGKVSGVDSARKALRPENQRIKLAEGGGDEG